MLCRIEGTRVKETLTLTVGSDVVPPLSFAPRVLDIVSTAAGEFLRPPAEEQPRWAGKAHEALCVAGAEAAIAATYRRILDNDPQPGEVALFGRYLAEVLLGPNLDVVEQYADAVDLRLRLNTPSLERLPWEMMHVASGPLAARPAHRISITREVQRGAADPTAPPAPPAPRVTLDLPLPLRVLFVVGATIDPVLRPGAEFLGLLRHLRIPLDPEFRNFASTNVHVRYLGDADVGALKQQLATFKPSVVHFICHGERQGGAGETRIVLKQLVQGAGGPVKQKLTLNASELCNAFDEAGTVPSAVVLNACYAGGASGSLPIADDGHRPFAAELVKRGVDIAVGMAGEVEDRACQLFAMRFYQALIAKEPLTVATTQARRAVLAAWSDYQQSIEWARPTLFVAEGVEATVGTSSSGTLAVIERADRFREVGRSPEILCDRYEILAAAQALFDLAERPRSDRLLVAIRVDADSKGLGKTRLLEEIAIRSTFDRFVPVIIRAADDPPQTFLEFALAISEAMKETRDKLELDPVLRMRARLVAFDVLRDPADPATDPDQMSDARFSDERHKLRTRLRAIAPAGGGAAASRVHEAILEDCARLADDVRALTGAPHRILILIDELHRYAGAIDPILDHIQYAGFGTGKTPIPVVVNYVHSTSEGESISKKLQHLPIERRPDLKRFEMELERQLAYRQLIVSAFNVIPSQKRDKKKAVEDFFTSLHQATGGRPVEFTGLKVEYFMNGARIGDTLVPANYEDILRQYGGK